MKKTKWLKGIGISLIVICLLLFINFIPTYKIETSNMNVIEGEWINVYYEEEEAAALDIFELAEEEASKLVNDLGFTKKQSINIYIYDKQSTMQTKKYGFIGPLLGLDWYIGDNRGPSVLLTSPANPGKFHTYENIKSAVLHEMVHAYISIISPDVRLWLTEGIALYLTNGEPFLKEYLEYNQIPSFKELQTKSPLKFSDMGGYTLAHTYIEYLEMEYGWDNVIKLMKTEDYQTIFQKTELEIYNEWVTYISEYRY